VIDWTSFLIPCLHSTPIEGGRVLSLKPTGEIEWTSAKRTTVSGSFSTGLQVRTATHTPDLCTHLEISGNPVKFFQGHNLWGTDDLGSLVVATAEHVTAALGLTPTDEDRAAWLRGDVQMTRVDCTESFHLASRAEVLSWLRAAEQTAHLSHRGRGQLVKGSTLYFGKNSRRWSLKLYSKGQEITAKGHGQDSILNLPSAVAWADKTLRAELTLRSMELKRLQLDHVRDWFPVDGVPFAGTEQLLRERLGNMTMTTTKHLSAEVMESLRPALRVAVQAWEGGSDLRATLPHRTFYKYRKELLPHGIDIATNLPKEVSNVVPLHRVLRAVPAQIPDWAVGTPLYFEPRRIA
jgi:II/X family phage/plasmid replication protein